MNAHRWNRWILTLLVCAALPLFGQTHVAIRSKDRLPRLSVEVAANQIRIAGAEPNQRVLLVGYSRWRQDYIQRLQRDRASLLADAEGRASLTLPSAVRPDSIWVAVDIRTGRYGSAAPAVSPRREMPRGKQAQEPAYFVIVRPGEGAWEADGGAEIPFDGLRAIGGSPARPASFREGDLLLEFSPEHGTFSSIRVEKVR